jgi:hypothetical protein
MKRPNVARDAALLDLAEAVIGALWRARRRQRQVMVSAM